MYGRETRPEEIIGVQPGEALGLVLAACPQPTDDDSTAKSSDAALKNPEISAGTLSPTFAADTAVYTADVPNGTASVTVTATANHAGATVEGDGVKPLMEAPLPAPPLGLPRCARQQ